jgi:hypothetical protein
MTYTTEDLDVMIAGLRKTVKLATDAIINGTADTPRKAGAATPREFGGFALALLMQLEEVRNGRHRSAQA